MTGRRFAVELMALIGLAVLLALLGPFGSFARPWPLRTLDWLCFMLGGALFFRPVIGAAGVLARHGTMKLPVAILFACLLAAFPTTILVAWCLAGMAWRQVTLDGLAALYPEVLLIGGVATMLQFAIATKRQADRVQVRDQEMASSPPAAMASMVAPDRCLSPVAEQPPETVAQGARTAAFLQRLPATLGRTLLCLENEDHYVRAHTDRGSTLILMRMADAVAELDGIEGVRTHRSWWVARHAVVRVVRRERAIGLVLSNGVEAPVARAMVPVLRQAGWLAGERTPSVPVPPG